MAGDFHPPSTMRVRSFAPCIAKGEKHVWRQDRLSISVFYGFVLLGVGGNFVAPSVWVPLGNVTSSASSDWSITVPERSTMTVSASPSERLISEKSRGQQSGRTLWVVGCPRRERFMPADVFEASRTVSRKVLVSVVAVPFRRPPILAMPLVRSVTPPSILFY